MDDQLWFSRARNRLDKHGLPPGYVQRLLDELADHLADLKQEGMEADVCSELGDPEQVAEAAIAAYCRSRFLGRHPVAAFLVFAISPVLSVFFLMFLGLMAMVTVFGWRTFGWDEHLWGLSLTIVACSTFLSILYGELALRLGIGRKWAVATCAVLGFNAMFWEFCGAQAVTGMLPVQFAVPFAADWWFTKRTCSHRRSATNFLVFVLSPVASYMLLWLFVILALTFGRLIRYLGPAALLMCVIPTVVPSLVCCKLAKGFGAGRKWMFISCVVLATFAAVQNFQIYRLSEYYTAEGGPRRASIGLTMTMTLVQFVIPLGIGWWFMRRKDEDGQVQVS